MRRLFFAAALAVCLWTPPSADAACVPAIVVDGTVLYGENVSGWKLPPTAGRHPALWPACNDAGQNEPDTPTTVQRFEGVPAHIAAISTRHDAVYIARGTLTVLATHPLHQPARRLARRGCVRGQTVEGTVTGADFDRLTLSGRTIRLDPSTRIVNRPAYERVLDGQRLRITATRCRARLIADRIAFVGPAIRPAAYPVQRGAPDDGFSFPWIALGAGLLGLVLAGCAIERLTRPRGTGAR